MPNSTDPDDEPLPDLFISPAEKAALDPEPLWEILTDCQLTRRKRYHAVIDPDGDPVFKSRLFWDCVEYLDAESVEVYLVRSGALTGREEVDRLLARKG